MGNALYEENDRLRSVNKELLEACKGSLDLLCTGYENGVASIHISNAGELISALKNAIEKADLTRRTVVENLS